MYDFTCINFMTVSQMLPLELAVGIDNVLLKFQVTLTRILFRVFVHRSPLLSTITRTTSTSTRSLNYEDLNNSTGYEPALYKSEYTGKYKINNV